MNEWLSIYVKSGGLEFFLFFLLPMGAFFVYDLAKALFLKKGGMKNFDSSPYRHFVLTMAVFILAMTATFFLMVHINRTIPANSIISASHLCASWDEAIFGTNLPFWMQDKNNPWRELFNYFDSAMIFAYSMLALVFSLALMLSLLKNFSLFLRFFSAAIVVVWISMPVWQLFPAYTPLDMYWNNYLSQSPPASIRNSLENYQPTDKLTVFFDQVRSVYNYFPEGVSTFPSMHVAWSVIIVYFCWKIRKGLLFFTAPYAMLNSVATMFTLQHYGVDVMAGVFMGVAAIVFSGLIKYEDDGKEITYLMKNESKAVGNFYVENYQSIKQALENKK